MRIDNDPLTSAAEIVKAGEHPDAVLEATYGWYWAVDVLIDAGVGTVAWLVLTMTLSEIATAVGGVLHDADPAAVVTAPGHVR